MGSYLFLGTAAKVVDTLLAPDLDDSFFESTKHPRKKISWNKKKLIFVSKKSLAKLRPIMPNATRGLLWHRILIEILEEINDEIAQIIPAEIHDINGNCLADDYFFVHVIYTPEVINFSKSKTRLIEEAAWPMYIVEKFVPDYSNIHNKPIFQSPGWYLPDVVFVRSDLANKIMSKKLDVKIFDPEAGPSWEDKPVYP